MSKFKSLLLLLTALLALAGCDSRQPAGGSEMILSPAHTKFRNTDITGLQYAKDFALKDHTGQPRTLADFRGKAVVVFFGYMHCPDVCPTTLAEMAGVMQHLGPLADKVQVLFVTVDPERDTQEKLGQYVTAFDPRFLGMTGDRAAFDKMAQEFKVFYEKVPGKEPGTYTMNHTSASYVYDPQGRLRLYLRHGQGPEPVVHDLKLLLAET